MDNLSAKMVGLWGSIIGGIIGGMFTYLGVKLTIDYEREKARESELTSILIRLMNMRDELTLHWELFNSFKKSLEKTDSLNDANKKEFIKFREANQTLLSNLKKESVSIDLETYNAVTKLLQIDLDITLLIQKNNKQRVGLETFFEKIDNILLENLIFNKTQTEKYMKEYKSLKRKLGPHEVDIMNPP